MKALLAGEVKSGRFIVLNEYSRTFPRIAGFIPRLICRSIIMKSLLKDIENM